jgi:hypothetical protein
MSSAIHTVRVIVPLGVTRGRVGGTRVATGVAIEVGVAGTLAMGTDVERLGEGARGALGLHATNPAKTSNDASLAIIFISFRIT